MPRTTSHLDSQWLLLAISAAVLLLTVSSEEIPSPGLDHVRTTRQSDSQRPSKSPTNGNSNNNPYPTGGGAGSSYPPPYGGYPPTNFNYNGPYNPYAAYPPYNPYQNMYYPSPQQFNPYLNSRFGGNTPSSTGQININIPSVSQPAPQPVAPNNINNVIYGPSPPANVNNNFYGATLSAPKSEEKKDHFCNANTQFNCYNGNCLSDPHQLCDGKNDCGNRVDEMNCHHLNYQIRLRSENDEADQYGNSFSTHPPPLVMRYEGIIEVSVKGQRGCVCNRNFDIHDADVACRELGFRKGCDKLNRVSRTKASELYSDGVPYLMDNVNCIGNETSLQECDFDGWGRADRSCGRRNIVSITCKVEESRQPTRPSSRFNFYDDVEVNPFAPAPPPVVSRAGNDFDPVPAVPPTQSPVPYYPAPVIPGPHKTPEPSFFNSSTTSVFNREETDTFSHTGGGEVSPTCADSQFTCRSTRKCIPIDRLCDRFPDCPDNSDETYEGCHQPIQVRLSGGQSVSEGRLEIRVHGIWGTVCDKSFGTNEAGVFCRSLGFLGQPEVVKDLRINSGHGPIWLDNLVCPADDTCCLTSCHNLNWGRSSCSHSQDVILRCSNLLKRN